MEDISIIIPIYNHERTLAQALDSILTQEMPYRSNIYCLDDFSSDGSPRILAEYQARFPDRVRVFRSPRNLGSGRGSHYFHRLDLPGRYWCILEGDDFWTNPAKLKMQIDFLERHPAFVGCSCNTTVIDGANVHRDLIAPSCQEWNLLDMLLLSDRYAFYVHTSGIIWRNIFKAKGFYLPPQFEKFGIGDPDLLHMMLAEGGLMRNIAESMSCYRMTGRGLWSNRTAAEQNAANESVALTFLSNAPRRIRVLAWFNRKLLALQRKLPPRHIARVRAMTQFLPKPINSDI